VSGVSQQVTMHHCTCNRCAAADTGKRLRERQRRREGGCHRPAGDAAEGASRRAGSVLCCTAAVPTATAAAAMLTSGCCCHAASMLSPAVCMSSPCEWHSCCEGPKAAVPWACACCGSRQRSRRVRHAWRHLLQNEQECTWSITYSCGINQHACMHAIANVRLDASGAAPG
jgi:hypothetical protein